MKALIIRHGAFGDCVHITHLPRLLSEQGYTVDVNTNFKGYQILYNNPFINKLSAVDISTYPVWVWQNYFDYISQGYDKVVNLFFSIEKELLAMESDIVYFMSSEVRRQRWSEINYYDQMTIKAGYPELCGSYQGEMFFNEEEIKIVERWINQEKFKNKFIILINLSGTGPHKRFVQAEEVAMELIKDPNVHIITTGSAECKSIDFADKHERMTSICGRFPFRQAALVTKYVNCTIGCESGLMCVSAMWNTPTVQLMTATNINAHNKYNVNDYSLQSPCYCSPCFKGPYQYIGCPSKDGNPLCVYFCINKIIEQVWKIKNDRKLTV